MKKLGMVLALIFLTSISCAAEISDSSQGLITHWKMESISANAVVDSSSNGHTATCTLGQCPTQTTGVFGNALQFDGTDDYLTIPYSTELNPSNYTISLWFMANDYSANQIIISNPKNPYTTLRYFLSTFQGKLSGGYYCDSDWRVIQSEELTNEQEYHGALTFDSTNNTTTLYLNGQQSAQTNFPCGLPESTTNISIAANLESYGSVIIDDVGIWNRALSASEILSLSQREANEEQCADLVDDDVIDIFDLIFVASRIGNSDSDADLDGDNIVAVSDLLYLVSHFGSTTCDVSPIEEPVPDCTINQEISSECSCDGSNYSSGYCCAAGWQATDCVEPTPSCIVGETITEECICQGQTVTSDYCCATGHSGSACDSGEINAVITATRTTGVTPMAVFFEGTNSTDTEGRNLETNSQLDVEITEYAWSFGDAHAYDVNPNTFIGFNSAHVFEEPGTYNVNLTIKDSLGNVDATTTSITVTSGSGNTYYVDSVLGNDSYNGLCMESDGEGCGPWQTYGYVMNQVNGNSGVPRESKVLFKRGQSFEQSQIVKLFNISEISFGAYGSSGLEKPEIIFTGNTDDNDQAGMIYCAGASDSGNVNKVAFSDITFNGNNSSPNILSNYSSNDTRPCSDFLFLRASLINSVGNIITTQKTLDKLFIIDSELLDSGMTQHYGKVSHYAFLNSEMLRMPNNHGFYLSHAYKGVISGNYVKGVSACSDTRHNLRISGWVIDGNPTKNVLVSNNLFDGETDGCSTWNTIHLGPNVDGGHEMYNVLFEKNKVINGSILIRVDGGYNDLIVRNNILDSKIDLGGPIIRIGKNLYGNHGVKRMLFANNTIINNTQNPSLVVTDPDLEGVEIKNNIFYTTRPDRYDGWWTRGIQVDELYMLNEVTIQNNLFYHTTFSPEWEYAFVLGTSQSPRYTISAFEEGYPETAFNNIETDPLFTNFSGDNFALQAGSNAIDAGVIISIINEDYSSNPRPIGTGFDIGAFESN